MKLFTLTAAIALLEAVSANTVVHTHVNYVTVQAGQGNQQGNQQGSTQLPTTSTEASSPSSQPTTLSSSYVSSEPTSSSSGSENSPSSSSSSSSPSSSSSSSSGGGSGSDDSEIDQCQGIDKDFAKDILQATNEKRSKHGAKSLKWDKTLYQYANDYAQKYSCDGQLNHSGGKYGENLAVGYKTGSSAVDSWYSEGKNYNFGSDNSFDHFTQLIWKGSDKLGCAYKDCSKENWGKYIICSYDPAGNIIGKGVSNLQAN